MLLIFASLTRIGDENAEVYTYHWPTGFYQRVRSQMATAPRDLIAFDAPAAVSQVTSLSTVSTDNRLRVFDIVSGKQRQVYTEPNHLSAQYTCIAFISVPDADHLVSKLSNLLRFSLGLN